MDAHLSKTGMTLSEAINHSKLIGYLNCRICGNLMTDSYNRVEMVNALRNDGLCSSCHFDIYYNNNKHDVSFS